MSPCYVVVSACFLRKISKQTQAFICMYVGLVVIAWRETIQNRSLLIKVEIINHHTLVRDSRPIYSHSQVFVTGFFTCPDWHSHLNEPMVLIQVPPTQRPDMAEHSSISGKMNISWLRSRLMWQKRPEMIGNLICSREIIHQLLCGVSIQYLLSGR